MRRAAGALGALCVVSVLVIGCGGSELNAGSSCRDFMRASSQKHDAAVSRVATQLRAPWAVTPQGRIRVNYICAGSPDTKLGVAVRRRRPQPAVTQPVATKPV